MWKDQMPSARTRMIGDLGWHLDPAHESGRVVCRENKPEPAWLLNGTGWIMNKLATIREQKQKAWEERFAAVQERLVMLDDGLAAGEACLAAAEACLAAAEACLAAVEVCLAAEEACLAENREAELRARIKGIEQLLLVKALGDAADHDRERDDHGGARGHCETHFRYSEGHRQPSEEQLADAEVHLKLVRAHLAVLEPAEQAEVHLVETMLPPAPEAPTREAKAVTVPEREVPIKGTKAAFVPKRRQA